MTSYAYYPGCALHSTAKEYDVSTRLVAKAVGIDLQELKDWACCGAASAHSVSHLLSVALPARDLYLAEKTGRPLVVPCPACFSRLKLASHHLQDKETLTQVKEILGADLRNTAVVEPLPKVLADPNLNLPIKKELKGLKVACYYGCLWMRPKKILNFEDEDNPQSLDRLAVRLGAESVPWAFKTECCGASMPLARPDMVRRLSHRLFTAAQAHGAECLVVACPLCHNNLDTRQREIEQEWQEKFNLPIIYFTQLMGLALGYSPKELCLDQHLIDPRPLLRKKGLA